MIYSVIIPLSLLFVPWLLVRYIFATGQTKNMPYAKFRGYLIVASLLWVASQILPNVPVSPQTDTFTMHMTGGAVAAVLLLYTLKAYGIRLREWWQLPVLIYFFASGLGVLNELFEFWLDSIGMPGDWDGDQWWDLLANNVGALLAYCVIKIFKLADQRG